ncbi:hypothetical protein SAMN05192573_110200 [Mucilaginibacter gossypii]|uniref:Uncharacterized protein n=1 Tax=Mucilaginibacter gossypii TaxID=551996 RepID=A0A1G8DE89_9SPHI|nr:hypothetical protein SAMN05192573_110200 [Mucilaginibacter gossypii]
MKGRENNHKKRAEKSFPVGSGSALMFKQGTPNWIDSIHILSKEIYYLKLKKLKSGTH